MQMISDKSRVLIASIHTVPREILAEIFSYLKGGYRDKVPAHARTETLLPTHVCQRWREIALSTPTLWNNIYINGSSSPKSVRDSEVECISAWLARAKDCPLAINLRRSESWSNEYDFATDDSWTTIFDILLRNSHRWRHAILISTSRTDFSGLRNNLPLLETLEINSPLGFAHVSGDAFEIAPRLSNLTLSLGTYIDILPWAQLKVFVTDHDLSLVHCLGLLQKMPNIVSISTEIWYINPESCGVINAPLSMTKLESLSIVEINPFSMSGFLTCLTLPSLKSIKFSADGPPDGDPDDDWGLAVISMVQRSACSIKSLEIESAFWSGPSTIGDLLQVTPQLETFGIGSNTEYDISNAIQSLMVPIGACSTPCLAPGLQHLKLLYQPSFEPQAFVDLVESRWRVTPGGSVTIIRSIKLTHIPSAAIFSSSHLERLGEFAAEGLDIETSDADEKPILFELGSVSS
ncbi:hypothetical protein HWV62_10084 [Athelia sp. TMB]|nr:hypothetical protein HWV62_10084 [Athelia sp. TMB]